ncbi:alanine racemase [Novosphingobium album (ex Liu et al. 2023)]|uniref:Alanine racemase n=1 Tax=Novosphingobium album (ex Liu et al. 2023) TaxID=3031130 RepID=A0ABT5WR08_9SPHN|nr:alanine racemase [Novosphingobium album (ex Liu et al. 2023)]MDE8652456.1 alanine racemase [Novosphingobium album (ex Liu et al. 2023)]
MLSIDLDALAENYRTIQLHAGSAQVAAVVKADGYGLGAIPVVQTLMDAGCRTFFVAFLGEAVALKSVLRSSDTLFVLNGLLPGTERDCAQLGAVPVLNSLDQVDRWTAMSRELRRTLSAALQIDTGMARLGLSAEEVQTLAMQRSRLNGIELKLVMSHLACADNSVEPFNERQVETFEALTRAFPNVARSLDNSGGVFLERGHFDLVRAGIALYGGAPRTGPNPMRPVVSLEARILQLRTVPAGAAVGYGLTHRCEQPSRIATISVGYADGWPRHLSNRGSAYIGGVRVSIAGRVSMDSITLDVTDVPDALLYPGAPVELIGSHQSIDDVADDAGTISYEILTQLGHRYTRIYSPARATQLKRSA